MSVADKQIVLVGVGHTNAHVLHMWRRAPIPGARLIAISNFPVATYSGMLPGSLAGQYSPHKMEINLQSLTRAARAELIIANAVGLDLEKRSVLFENLAPLKFDVLSIGVGSIPGMGDTDTANTEQVVLIKPMQTFLMRLFDTLKSVEKFSLNHVRAVIVGGGVGGIEITLCLPGYLQSVLKGVSYTLTVVDAHDQIGRGLSPMALRKVETLLKERQVRVLTNQHVSTVREREVVLEEGNTLAADLVIWATGAAPPRIIREIELPKDKQGFLLTRNTLQSTGDEAVFAVGDAGTLEGDGMPKAGVYAVREGPILWRNIRALLRNGSLARYRPQHDFLRLLNSGDGKAIMDYKGVAMHARWCWLLKDWIDGRFMSRFEVTRG